ncbi:MAG: ABC transporter permease, partial [Clostridia bacterium]|nr:ABC transporter permease [Clostridia bacterium]
MRVLVAFFKKELCEHVRSGKLLFLVLVFLLLGIMNPAIAKLTPWLLETFAESLAESGIVVGAVTVTARDSWVQFYKNAPMGLIAFVLLESGIFAREYSAGTLILPLTKGLRRETVVLSKGLVLFLLWTV